MYRERHPLHLGAIAVQRKKIAGTKSGKLDLFGWSVRDTRLVTSRPTCASYCTSHCVSHPCPLTMPSHPGHVRCIPTVSSDPTAPPTRTHFLDIESSASADSARVSPQPNLKRNPTWRVPQPGTRTPLQRTIVLPSIRSPVRAATKRFISFESRTSRTCRDGKRGGAHARR